MTRVKKTRSLKRIHSVKTGSISRLKRQAREEGGDRQTGKRVKGRKVLSVYEKYLLENPEARERDKPAAKPEAEKKDSKPKADEGKEKRAERQQTLLEQLESKDLKDIY